jgi:hypothetical protein
MSKKPKTVQVGSREYHEQLIKHYAVRCTALVHCKGNLSRDDLEYLAEVAVKLKDARLKQCIAELIGWGDEERAELETMLALGYEAMKLCSPSRMREAAMRVSLKYHLKEHLNETNASSSDGRQAADVPMPAEPQT